MMICSSPYLKKMACRVGSHVEAFDEEVWTFLVAKCVEHQLRLGDDTVYRMLVGSPFTESDNIGLEVQPLGPRLKEGNTRLDMALGAIQKRTGTDSGIAFQQCATNIEIETVCFVEAKFLSDLSTRVEHSPFRDQMTRIIENLLTFQPEDGSFVFPQRTIFTLLTPSAFRQHPHTRMYGFLFKEYVADLQTSQQVLIQRIRSTLEHLPFRDDYDWTSSVIPKQLLGLQLRWVSYEDIFHYFLSEHKILSSLLHKIDSLNLLDLDVDQRNDIIQEIWKVVK